MATGRVAAGGGRCHGPVKVTPGSPCHPGGQGAARAMGPGGAGGRGCCRGTAGAGGGGTCCLGRPSAPWAGGGAARPPPAPAPLGQRAPPSSPPWLPAALQPRLSSPPPPPCYRWGHLRCSAATLAKGPCPAPRGSHSWWPWWHRGLRAEERGDGGCQWGARGGRGAWGRGDGGGEPKMGRSKAVSAGRAEAPAAGFVGPEVQAAVRAGGGGSAAGGGLPPFGGSWQLGPSPWG